MRVIAHRFAAGLLLFTCLFVTAPYAFAHARPKVMVPAADSVVASPSAITVTFSEAIEGKFSSLNLTNEAGKKMNTAASMPKPNDPKSLTLALPSLPPGGYLVQWVSVATDGHRMEGEYKFTVK